MLTAHLARKGISERLLGQDAVSFVKAAVFNLSRVSLGQEIDRTFLP